MQQLIDFPGFVQKLYAHSEFPFPFLLTAAEII